MMDYDDINRQVYEMLGPRNYLVASVLWLVCCVAAGAGIVWWVID